MPVPVGAVVTIEPGAYLEGWGGIRLEDDVVVTQAGAEYLSTPSPELLAL
jgi:Xaa-Pro aminopeptidase